MISSTEQKYAATEFVAFWTGKGYEKGQTQPFWLSLLRVLGIDKPEAFIEFEEQAHIDSAHGFIDGYIPATHVLVEQKSLGKSLRAGIPQSDGSVLNPFQQARRYSVDLPYSRRPRWVVTCNFSELLIYDMEKPNAEPESLLLKDLPEQLYRLKFLVDTGSETIRREEEISKRAGEVVGVIYDALLKQYKDPKSPQTLKSLNELCVRLVFLLYAEDADVFGHLQFHDYLKNHGTKGARFALIQLFKVLDTPIEKRDPYLDSDLAAFPYVNGGLFANENIEIPQFTDEILDLVLKKGSEDFDWKDISPTIFGAVFESTLNPETRRTGGMHYTSVANIHKVIDPLFLDELKAKLSDITAEPNAKARNGKLREYIDSLASLTFLDPACGSGNFLTETFISLRRLENKALSLLLGGQSVLDFDGDKIRVSLSQFHGIEINDFACRVAQTALWIAENQMLRETEEILHRNIDFLPLKSYSGIIEGNALRLDWAHLGETPQTPTIKANRINLIDELPPNADYLEVHEDVAVYDTVNVYTKEIHVGAETPQQPPEIHYDYIIGNPPFVGARLMLPEQKADLEYVFGKKWKGLGNLDYVSGWYKKAADMMAMSPTTHSALVSTNSVTQGDTVSILWKKLFENGISIDFAHRTFQWDSESNDMAHVHCVIVGFSINNSTKDRVIFDGESTSYVPHINAYLLSGPDVFAESRRTAISAPHPLAFGSMPNDGGYLSDWSTERKNEILRQWPETAPLFRRIVGSQEYINGIERWCLWLKGANPSLIRSIPPLMEAIAAVRALRLASKRVATQKLANAPMLFGEIRHPENGNYLIIPRTSSERRRYIPIGFLSSDIISNDSALIVPSATLYDFGILTSNVHNAWMRAVAGRLKSDYRYSAQIVYNNFPWPTVLDDHKNKIERTAQAILDARANYPDCSLADLYDELTMPPDLRKAHQENDRAVMAAYGFSTKMTESECVAELFRLYQNLINNRMQDSSEQ